MNENLQTTIAWIIALLAVLMMVVTAAVASVQVKIDERPDPVESPWNP